MRRIVLLFLALIALFSSAAAEINAVNFADGCAVIDAHGKRVIDSTEYDLIFVLKNELGKLSGYAAGVADNNDGVRYALLSPTGERLTDFIYTYIASAGMGFIACCRDNWYCLTSRGRAVGEIYSDIEYIGNHTCFAVIGDPYDEISDRLVILSAKGAYYVPDMNIQYGLAPFADGLMPLVDGDTLLYGYVNSDGAWVLEPSYKYAESFADECAIIAGKKGYGLIDINGNEIISPKYDFMTRSGGIVCAVMDDTAYVITTDGRMLSKTGLDGGSASLTGDYLVITAADEVRILDASGAHLFTCDATSSVEAAGGFFIVRSGGWSNSHAQLTDITGRPVSQIWASLLFLEDGMFAYGMRDENGEMLYGLLSAKSGTITECAYTSITLMQPGLYIAVSADGAALLDNNGIKTLIS